MLIDTHCHIHDSDYPLDADEVLSTALARGVQSVICVGTTTQSSKDAIEFAKSHSAVYASVGVHPHDAKDGYDEIAQLAKNDAVVAVGEVGLDYYYSHSPREVQIAALEFQLQTALDNQLPVIFHVRDAFDDFWPVFNNFTGIKGVLHSFTDSLQNMERGISAGLYIGVNGISTFTKDSSQRDMFKGIPIERLVFETDAPYLTPAPFRGKVNTPAMVCEVAKFYSELRDMSYDDITTRTTNNAKTLFDIT